MSIATLHPPGRRSRSRSRPPSCRASRPPWWPSWPPRLPPSRCCSWAGAPIAGRSCAAMRLPRRAARLGPRGRGPARRDRPPDDRARLDGVRHRDRPAGLAALDRRRPRAARDQHDLPDLLDVPHRPRPGGRDLPRADRHPADHAVRGDHLGADRDHGRDLPHRVRQGQPARALDHLPRRRDDRHPLDRRRPVRLRALHPALRTVDPPRHRRLGGAGAADDPDRRALDRGDAAARARRAAGGVVRPGCAEVAHDRQGRAADRARRHRHRRDPRRRARRRRDRAAAADRRPHHTDQLQRRSPSG